MSPRHVAAQAPATGRPAGTNALPVIVVPPAGSLRRGRFVLIVGIVLLANTLRHAVTGLSPLLPVVRGEMGLDIAAASFLGKALAPPAAGAAGAHPSIVQSMGSAYRPVNGVGSNRPH